MSKKKARPTPAVNCKCSKCGKEAHSIPEKQHRNCKDKNNKGLWEPA